MYTLGSEPPGKAATSHVGLLVYFIVVPLLPAQVLVTAENGGRGSRSLMAAANLIQVPGFGVFSNNSLQYGQGITGRIDGFIGYGNIATTANSRATCQLAAISASSSALTPCWTSRYITTPVSH